MTDTPQPKVFIERRKGQDRRQEPDSCSGLPVDLYHRKRRKRIDRRQQGRNTEEDIAAYYASQGTPQEVH
jgi:hypothetical protein